MSDSTHLRGVAIAISSPLQLLVVEVTPVDERIMRVRLKHTLGFMSLVAVYAPTKMCETEEKEMFYAKLDSVLDQCPSQDTLIVLGNFTGSTGTERVGYELCVSPHGPRPKCGFASEETLENNEKSRAARPAGNQDRYRALSHRTRALLRRDKERYVRSLAEEVEGHFNVNDL